MHGLLFRPVEGLGICPFLTSSFFVEEPSTPVIFLCPFFLITQVQAFPSSLYILAVAPFTAPWESQITSVTTSGKSNVHLGSMEWWYTGALPSMWWPSEMHSCAFSILTPRRSAKKAHRCHTVSLLIEVLLYCVCSLKLSVCLPIT